MHFIIRNGKSSVIIHIFLYQPLPPFRPRTTHDDDDKKRISTIVYDNHDEYTAAAPSHVVSS